ncbi:predicted protein [Naegleria gruberi]|uniref:Predicted protein n=1 Tax=Naegleria gruberi TaxID=5762 RepID=D2UZZ7_NAEGR|nr:uncharacterized protein NAEGRDRAFT_62118 [Naegleria gruberi]EFC50020.1 predicted protein [Naegleria gruberi]|eukprot:XP_002682764.1 predicted protein [Naegleria gruberi strain NEG-M]
MDNGNYLERANLDLFNQPVEEVEQFVVQDVVPTNSMPSYNRNKLRDEMMENNQEESAEPPVEETKKKRKKRKPKKTDDEWNEEGNKHESNLPTLHEKEQEENTTDVLQPKKEVIRTLEKDLFADMARTHYLSISPNDIIVGKENEEAEEVTDEPIESKNLKVGGPLSLRQKTIFIESM